ncbi:MAG: SDR family oxidoreductase, partial [Chthoniobacterales bacterium]
ENERRWLTWDLLCGRVDRAHPMWSYLAWLGAEERDIEFFNENPCPPEIIGINHYATSERYLDENLRDHPPETHGGNGRDRYADVAAVRARLEGITGPATLLRETCDRYDLPVAVTEAHLGCTREEQLRWLGEIWRAAQSLRNEGRDIRAVTAWSLLGAFDWDSLLTREHGTYESGAFDLRSDPPRPTAVSQMIQNLAHTGSFAHPVLQTPGWWRRDVRLLPSIAARSRAACPSNDVCAGQFAEGMRVQTEMAPRILITGAGGTLAAAFAHACDVRGLSCLALRHDELDIADGHAVTNAIASHRVWAVINCAGFSRVDEAEESVDACRRVSLCGAKALAHACREADIPLVTFSSEHVFDGSKGVAYVESDACNALNFLGQTKIAADETVLAISKKALVIRAGEILAPQSEADSLRVTLQQLARGERVRVANDEHFSVSFVPELISAALDLLIDGETGIWHLANDGVVTAEELLARAAAMLQLDTNLIEAVPSWSLRRPAPRGRMRSLSWDVGRVVLYF